MSKISRQKVIKVSEGEASVRGLVCRGLNVGVGECVCPVIG